MRNVAAEVFCSTATTKCTKMEKRLESLLKNNYHQRRKIAGNCFGCLRASFLPSTADAARAPPSQCLHANSPPDTSHLSSHHTSLYWGWYRCYLYTIYVLFIYYVCRVIWVILPLHTQLATEAPWQTPKSTGCPSTADCFFVQLFIGLHSYLLHLPTWFLLVPILCG